MKIVIVVSGGNIQAVHADKDAEIVIVDYDNLKAGDKPEELEPYSPDTVSSYMYLQLDGPTDLDKQVAKRLKELNF